MDFSNFWWQAAAADDGGGGDPGDPIGESLRFRGAQRLSKDNFTQLHSRNSTISYWIKRGKLGTQQTIGVLDNGGNNGFGEFLPDNTFRTFTQTGSIDITKQVFRDPSAWMHFHLTQTTLWVNGEIALSGNLIDPTSGHDKFFIGVYGLNNIRYFDGYLAEFHFVDGQTLDPTTFGRYNSKGIWVPVDPEKDGDTAWYGTNGFHLTFADPGDVGKDYSGNGNDFTATGFDTVPPGMWSPGLSASNNATYVTAASGNRTATVNKPEQAFNGVFNDSAYTNSTNQYMYWVPPAPLTGVTDLKIQAAGSGATFMGIYINGVDTGLSFNSFTDNAVLDISSAIPPDGTITELAFYSNGATVTSLNGIYVNNGPLLVDSTGVTYDIMQDSPTHNYATWNPLVPTTTTETNANLSTTASSWWNAVPTIKLPATGKWYWEKATGTTFSASTIYGLRQQISIASNEQYADFFNPGVGIQHDGAGYINGVYATGIGPVATSSTDEFEFAYDADAGKYWVALNGTWFNGGDPVAGTGEGATIDPAEYYIVEGNYGVANTDINFGQQPFRYTPPEGFLPLSTANMLNELPDVIEGEYTANGIEDGPFIYTGCIPGKIEIYSASMVLNYTIDYVNRLNPSFNQHKIDFLSNGFKIRSNNTLVNNIGRTFNYKVYTTHTGGEYDGNKVPFNAPAPAVSN